MTIAFATRGELETSIADTLDRSDLDDSIPGWIVLCEANVNRVLRASDMLVRKRAVSDKRYMEMPDDCRELYRLAVAGRTLIDPELTYITPGQMLTYNGYQPTSDPLFYTINGRQIEVGPAPGAVTEFELHYYRTAFFDEDDGNDATNWLLEKHPDIYFYGSLLHSSPFLKNDERIATWRQFYTDAVADLSAETMRLSVSGGPLNRIGGIKT